MNVLLEAVGSMPFGSQLKYYRETGWNLIGMDITSTAFGFYKNVKPYLVPKYEEREAFDVIEKIVKRENIDVVFPTINEGLLSWSERRDYFKDKYDTTVMISNVKTIDICTDKWKTYLFFEENGIPTPRTSLNNDYELIKPRVGRGSEGIFYKGDDADFNMKGRISQEIVGGQEYTVDVLCDFDGEPVYIVPRKRLSVESGTSTRGVTVYDSAIIEFVKKIIALLKPIGIVNIQCFKDDDKLWFIEINPRLGGGSTLSFASSDNWFVAIDKWLKGEEYAAKEVAYGNYMLRYYEEVIINEEDLFDGQINRI